MSKMQCVPGGVEPDKNLTFLSRKPARIFGESPKPSSAKGSARADSAAGREEENLRQASGGNEVV